MNPFAAAHTRFVLNRRANRLSRHLAALLPDGVSVLDVGAGDGRLAAQVATLRPDVTLRGIDVLVRPQAAIPVRDFDGRHVPLADGGVDVVMLVDVLHHADDPRTLLQECARAAKRCVVIKDHLREGFGAAATLRFMDWVGNARFGVRMTYRYWSRAEWRAMLADAGLVVRAWQEELALYPAPLSLLFDRSLHFIARLDKA